MIVQGATFTRRSFATGLGMTLAGLPLLGASEPFAEEFTSQQIVPFRTPYKYGKLVLAASADPAAFDSKSVDDPFVFYHEGQFKMLYIGFDGTGYQTGLATSPDLIHWKRIACVAAAMPRRNTRSTTSH